MAITTGFKTPCPACKALVLIKDAKLIGKKVECPKCKHRFIVEDPVERDKNAVAGLKAADAAKANGAADESEAEAETEAPSKPREAVTAAKPAAAAAASAKKEAATAEKPKPPAKPAKAPPPVEDDEDEEDDEEEVAPKGKTNGKAANGKAPAGKAPAAKANGKADAKAAAKKKPARNEDDAEADEEVEEKASKKKKKKGEGNKQLPLILAGVGVLALAVAGLIIWKPWGKKDSTPVAANNNMGQGMPGMGDNPKGGEQNPAPPKDGKQPGEGGGAGGPGAAAGPELTNLLPKTVQNVFQINFKDFLDSPMGTAAFGSGAFNDDEIRARLGFSLKAIDNLILAENYAARWSFTVLHSLEPLNERTLKKTLGLQDPKERAIKNQAYYRITRNDHWLANLGRLSLGAPAAIRNAQPKADASPLYLRLHNPQTLIVAHLQPMQQFLADEGHPEPWGGKKAAPADPPPSTNPGGAVPGAGPAGPLPGGANPPGQGGGDFPKGSRPPPGAGGAQQGAPALGSPMPVPGQAAQPLVPGAEGQGMGQGGQPAAPPPPPRLAETFSTINPTLKTMLDRMAVKAADSDDRVLFISATDMRAARIVSRAPDDKDRVLWRIRPVWDVTNLMHEKTDRINVLGTTLHMKEQLAYLYKNVMDCGSEAEAGTLKDDLKDAVAPELVKLFRLLLDHKVQVAKEDAPVGNGNEGKDPNVPGMVNPNVPPGVRPPPAGNPNPGAFPGQNPNPGAFPGQNPNPGAFPGGDPQFPGGQNPAPKQAEKPEEIKSSRIVVRQNNKRVSLRLDLVLDQPAYQRLEGLMQVVMIGLRGEIDAADGMARRHDLAAAGKLLGEKGLSDRDIAPGNYPPGAFKRPPAGSRSYRDPNQRVSWMAALLPYLDRKNLYDHIAFDKSWKDPANWLQARTLVPEFLDPTYPRGARYTTNPGMPFDPAVTHFVGLAGIGLDAADYGANDPAVVNKLGVFGYERGASLDEIRKSRGGLSNTVLLIRVPHDGPSGVHPWMAGGGSTVRTVPEKDSVEPFLSTEKDGTRGTYVLMTDSSVRYIKKGISDAAFKALVTVRGPAPEDFEIDKVAPIVKAPDKEALPVVAPEKPAPQPPKADPPQKVPAQPATGAPDGWKQYTSQEAGFTALLPSVPTRQELTLPTPLGPTKIQVFTAPLKGTDGCIITYSTVPVPIPPGQLDLFFAGVKNGILRSAPGAKIVAEKRRTVAGSPAIDLELQVGPSKVRMTTLLAGVRAYSITVPGDGQEAAAVLKRVVDSFRPLNGGAPAGQGDPPPAPPVPMGKFPQQPPGINPPQGQALNVDAAALVREYQANRQAAEQKYNNKVLTVRGVMGNARQPGETMLETNLPSILPDARPGATDVVVFALRNRAAGVGLRPGTNVVVQGRCLGFNQELDVVLTDAQLLPR